MSEPIWKIRDAQFLRDNPDFAAWIAELNKIDWLVEGYGGPVEDSTGVMCWYDNFKMGETPLLAAKSDRENWE